MSINKINFKFLNIYKAEQEFETQKIIYSASIDNNISFIINNELHLFEYMGFRIIKSQNTNKTIKELLYNNDNNQTFIKINDKSVCLKDIIIISPFTKISDILSSRTNGNLHNYLKEMKCSVVTNEIENFIIKKIDYLTKDISELLEYNLLKCDIINFIDVKERFIDNSNIETILKIVSNYDQKKLIIFNDVQYLDFNKVSDYLQFYNFLYFVNSYDNDYQNIKNYNNYLIEFDLLSKKQGTNWFY